MKTTKGESSRSLAVRIVASEWKERGGIRQQSNPHKFREIHSAPSASLA